MNAILLTNYDLSENFNDGDRINLTSFKESSLSRNDMLKANLIIYLDHETKIAKILKSRYVIHAISNIN